MCVRRVQIYVCVNLSKPTLCNRQVQIYACVNFLKPTLCNRRVQIYACVNLLKPACIQLQNPVHTVWQWTQHAVGFNKFTHAKARKEKKERKERKERISLSTKYQLNSGSYVSINKWRLTWNYIISPFKMWEKSEYSVSRTYFS